MHGKNVTYLLGAGASCNSQPLVSDMKKRMQILLNLLNPSCALNKEFKTKYGDNLDTNVLFKRYYPIVIDANKHYTPDTYAKKLSLTNKLSELELFKEFLILYFIFEQENDLMPFGKSLESEEMVSKLPKDQYFVDITGKKIKKNKKEKLWDKISTPLDYRYDVFFATLLDPTTLLLPSNNNIISWNYDNQWELAYKEYAKDLNINEISKRLNINVLYDPNKSNIIKVNGYCNCWDEEEKKELTFYSAIDKLVNGNSIKNTIEFAWEGTRPQYDAIYKIMENSDIVVIIGYSFPNFNREVDKTIFYKYHPKPNKEIIVQVPDIYEYEKIKQRIQTIKPISDSVFKHIPDKDQFYIPL
jgi:hypothetical protein